MSLLSLLIILLIKLLIKLKNKTIPIEKNHIFYLKGKIKNCCCCYCCCYLGLLGCGRWCHTQVLIFIIININFIIIIIIKFEKKIIDIEEKP
jgi:hypothetical protein